jgi:hypothetical protein
LRITHLRLPTVVAEDTAGEAEDTALVAVSTQEAVGILEAVVSILAAADIRAVAPTGLQRMESAATPVLVTDLPVTASLGTVLADTRGTPRPEMHTLLLDMPRLALAMGLRSESIPVRRTA